MKENQKKLIDDLYEILMKINEEGLEINEFCSCLSKI